MGYIPLRHELKRRLTRARCLVPPHLGVMTQRLRDAVESESDADATREEHEEPGGVVELRLVVVVAQLDRGILGKVYPNPKDDPGVHDDDVHPGEGGGDPVSGGDETPLSVFRRHGAPDHEHPDDRDRAERHRRVEAHFADAKPQTTIGHTLFLGYSVVVVVVAIAGGGVTLNVYGQTTGSSGGLKTRFLLAIRIFLRNGDGNKTTSFR